MPRPSFLPILLGLGLVFGLGLPLTPSAAQTDQLRVNVANLTQDLNALSHQVKALRLEVEELRRENRRLQAEVAAAGDDRQLQTEVDALAASLDALRREYRSADEAQKAQIISEVTRQITALAEETQSAIETVAEAVGSEPQVATPVHFSDDYPQTGKPYVVRAGDTLSKIAREHGSTVRHIQNANQIVNPARDLRVGDSIFIPIAQ